MSATTRRIVDYAANLATIPLWIWFKLLSMVVGETYACMAVSQRSARWTGLIGIYLRRSLLKRIINLFGLNVSISLGTVLTKPTIEIGDSVYIGSYCILGDVRVGCNTLIADHVCIPSGAAQHGIARLDIPIKDQPEEYRTVTIGNDCWIGSGSVILANLGNHCVVGAGSVVTKPVSDYQIVAGNPAKAIGDRRSLSETLDSVMIGDRI